jgi:hypothetical protein
VHATTCAGVQPGAGVWEPLGRLPCGNHDLFCAELEGDLWLSGGLVSSFCQLEGWGCSPQFGNTFKTVDYVKLLRHVSQTIAGFPAHNFCFDELWRMRLNDADGRLKERPCVHSHLNSSTSNQQQPYRSCEVTHLTCSVC